MSADTLLTAPELAAVLKVNVKDLYRKAQTGEIPSYRFGKSRRFKLDEVLAAHREVTPVRTPLLRRTHHGR